MIQLFARIEDIIPTEHWVLEEPKNFYDPEEAILADHEMNCKEAFLPSIREEGIKYQMKVRPDGHIADGNCRYWCARAGRTAYMGHPFKVGFLPIDVKFFVGRYNPFDWRIKQPVEQYARGYTAKDIPFGTPNKYNFQMNPLFEDWRTERQNRINLKTAKCSKTTCKNWATTKCYNCKHAIDLRDNYDSTLRKSNRLNPD